jgi:dihydroorotate dehydrogenase (NAD+) catalytic subunit
MTGEDAVEFIITGATAVQTGTLHFIDPAGPIHVLEGITEYCRQHKITAIRDCVGTLITE